MLPGIQGSLLLGSPLSGFINGGEFIYVGSDGTLTSGPNRLLRSVDGLTWTTKVAPFDGVISGRIAKGGGMYVAMGHDPTSPQPIKIASSPDLVTWTPRSCPIQGIVTYPLTQEFQEHYGWDGSVAYGNNAFVMVGTDGTPGQLGTGEVPKIATSLDAGKTWTITSVPWALGRMYDVIFAAGRFMAIGFDRNRDSVKVATSIDGVTWSVIGEGFAYAGTQPYFVRIAYGNGLWVMSGTNWMMPYQIPYPGHGGYVWTSRDGASWTTNAFSNNPNIDWSLHQRIQFANGQFHVAGSVNLNGTFVGMISSSPDAVNWTRRGYSTPYLSSSVQNLVFGAGRYVAGMNSNGVPGSSPAILTGLDLDSLVKENTAPVNTTGICFNLDFI